MVLCAGLSALACLGRAVEPLVLGRGAVDLVPVALVVLAPLSLAVALVHVAVAAGIDAVVAAHDGAVVAFSSAPALPARGAVAGGGAARRRDVAGLDPLVAAGRGGRAPLRIGVVPLLRAGVAARPGVVRARR